MNNPFTKKAKPTHWMLAGMILGMFGAISTGDARVVTFVLFLNGAVMLIIGPMISELD